MRVPTKKINVYPSTKNEARIFSDSNPNGSFYKDAVSQVQGFGFRV